MESIYFNVENFSGKQDLKRIKRGLDTLHGVTSVSVNAQDHRVAVDYDATGVDSRSVENCLHKLGYDFTRIAPESRE